MDNISQILNSLSLINILRIQNNMITNEDLRKIVKQKFIFDELLKIGFFDGKNTPLFFEKISELNRQISELDSNILVDREKKLYDVIKNNMINFINDIMKRSLYTQQGWNGECNICYQNKDELFSFLCSENCSGRICLECKDSYKEDYCPFCRLNTNEMWKQQNPHMFQQVS